MKIIYITIIIWQRIQIQNKTGQDTSSDTERKHFIDVSHTSQPLHFNIMQFTKIQNFLAVEQRASEE